MHASCEHMAKAIWVPMHARIRIKWLFEHRPCMVGGGGAGHMQMRQMISGTGVAFLAGWPSSVRVRSIAVYMLIDHKDEAMRLSIRSQRWNYVPHADRTCLPPSLLLLHTWWRMHRMRFSLVLSATFCLPACMRGVGISSVYRTSCNPANCKRPKLTCPDQNQSYHSNSYNAVEITTPTPYVGVAFQSTLKMSVP